MKNIEKLFLLIVVKDLLRLMTVSFPKENNP
jgi:hypothetical protein